MSKPSSSPGADVRARHFGRAGAGPAGKNLSAAKPDHLTRLLPADLGLDRGGRIVFRRLRLRQRHPGQIHLRRGAGRRPDRALARCRHRTHSLGRPGAVKVPAIECGENRSGSA